MEDLRPECDHIVREAIGRVMPGPAVRRALAGREFGPGRRLLVSVGKAGWPMARAAWESLGEPVLLTDSLDCEAREAGSFLAAVARSHQNTDRSLAFLAGGETVVHLAGHGLGGGTRNWPCRRPGELPDCGGPPFSQWGATAQTARPTPPEAMWTAVPPQLWPSGGGSVWSPSG
jgi:glycerate-2-kinase